MKVLVTGGGGFLGGAIVRGLIARGDTVRSLSRSEYPVLRALGVEQVRGDLADSQIARQAVEGCALVFHVAAKAGIWGSFAEYYQSNVTGTRNVIAACRVCGVERLVFTSSPSVVFGGRDMEGVDESVPYPGHYDAFYPATKAEAEQLIRAANDETLATVALRPHLIWGPGDTNLVPRIMARARAGRLRRIGRRANLVDSTYIDDAATAHLNAADRLAPGSPIAGKVYFISQGEPWPIWDLINRILRAAHLPPVTRTIPRSLALMAGGICEAAGHALRLENEPPMTRFLARELSSAHWFNITAARRELGYQPSVSIEEGMRRLEQALLTGSVLERIQNTESKAARRAFTAVEKTARVQSSANADREEFMKERQIPDCVANERPDEGFTFDTNAQMIPAIERAVSAFRRDLPELLKDRRNDRKWVAYDQRGERIGINSSEWKLYQECLRRGYPEGEFVVRCIFPEAPDTIALEELIDI